MAADGTGKIDINNLINVDLSSLTEEQKTELLKQQAMQRFQTVQEGIQAELTGNKEKLAEVRAKFAEGRATLAQLGKKYDNVRDTYFSQSTTVWSASRNLNFAREEFNFWNGANTGYQAYQSGASSDMTTFSGGRFGSTVGNLNDPSSIRSQGSLIGRRVDEYGKALDAQQLNYDSQQEVLAQNKKDKDAADRQWWNQQSTNKLILDEMQYYTNLITQGNLFG